MLRKMLNKSFLLIIVIAFYACKHEPQLVNKGVKTLASVQCSSDSIYFYNDIVPLLINNCAFSGCHSTVSLSSYRDIINIGDITPGDTTNSYLYTIITTGNLNKRMPPIPRDPLDSLSISKVAKWILQGAKPNSCSSCNEDEYKFNAHILPKIITQCGGCHATSNASGGIMLTNYFQIEAQASSGKLLGSLNHAFGFSAMPPNGKLPSCEIKVIEKWILNGMKND